MTENEAINVLQLNKPFTASKEANNAIEMAIQAIEEVQAYRAIGTVEEVKNAYGRGYNQGSIDRAEELQKCREYGYNKAIDEFAEKLNTDVESFEAEVNGIRADLLTLDYFSEFVFDVAERLKGGAT